MKLLFLVYVLRICAVFLLFLSLHYYECRKIAGRFLDVRFAYGVKMSDDETRAFLHAIENGPALRIAIVLLILCVGVFAIVEPIKINGKMRKN